MASSNLLNLHKSPLMAAENNKLFHQCVLLALFSQILNHKESASDQLTLSSSNVPK